MNVSPLNIVPDGGGLPAASAVASAVTSEVMAWLGVRVSRTIGKYQTMIGNGRTTVFAISQSTHGLATDGSVFVQVSSGSAPYLVANSNVEVGVDPTDGTVTLAFAYAPKISQYRVVLIG